MLVSKRNFIKTIFLSPAFIIAACAVKPLKLFGQNFFQSKTSEKIIDIELPPLPYARNALAPYISEKTLNLHYEKHHGGSLANLKKLTAGTDWEKRSLEEVIKISHTNKIKTDIFNNAAQVWNHTFYWYSMSPNGGGKPSGEVLKKIETDFGSYKNFITEFKNAGATQFGSGWVWLVLDGDKLKVTKTSNAETPLITSTKPLLTMDVWEHSYYLDYRNDRPNYIDAFLNHLINWDFVSENLKKAKL
jgi:superoxide dismutase, Fe-Mn family